MSGANNRYTGRQTPFPVTEFVNNGITHLAASATPPWLEE